MNEGKKSRKKRSGIKTCQRTHLSPRKNTGSWKEKVT